MSQQKHRQSDGRVHVLFFAPSLGGGGAEMHLLRVLNCLDRQKFRLSLALGRSGGTYESSLAKDVAIHILNTGGVNSSTLRMIRSAGPLRRVIQAEQPDILCSVLDHANTVAILASRGVLPRPKIVLSVQNPPSIRYGHTWHIVSRLMLLLIPNLYPQADQVIALSKGVAEDLLTLAPTIRDRTDVIYNAGVDSSVLNRAREALSKAELPQNGPLIVACGRLTEQKGFPHLIEALAHVRQVAPAYLWIVGEGKQRQYLENKIQQLGLTNYVRLLGFQSNPYKYMAAADVFVLSSLFEGFGNVVVEAMACGAPVVATNCPYGPGEIIEDGISGLLVPPANPETLAGAIVRVLTDQELKQTLIQNGKARAQDFNAEAIASTYGELFLRVTHAREIER